MNVEYLVTLNFQYYDRAMGFLILTLLLFANLTMRTRLSSRRKEVHTVNANIMKVIRDFPYILCLLG